MMPRIVTNTIEDAVIAATLILSALCGWGASTTEAGLQLRSVIVARTSLPLDL